MGAAWAALAVFGQAHAQGVDPAEVKERVLHVFRTSNAGTGAGPQGGLVQDANGNFYGTTEMGGAGLGSVFKMSPDGKGGWSYKTIYSLTGNTDGSFPQGQLAIDAQGNLYGVSSIGGESSYNGAVWELSAGADGTWSLARSHAFNLDGTEGATPLWGVVVDSAGNVYGTTNGGGNTKVPYGFGVAFELTPSDSGWTMHTIHVFEANAGGVNPNGLTLAMNGDLFGSAQGGGSNGVGNVFRLHKGSAGWTFRNIYEFAYDGGIDGMFPYCVLVQDRAGNLYGSTLYDQTDYGTVFKLSPPSNASGEQTPWTLSTLYQFTGGADGGPGNTLALDELGNVYGASASFGTYGWGNVYKLSRTATGRWPETVLYSFTGDADGANPVGLTLGQDKKLYGTTKYGGSDTTVNGNGVVFHLGR